jgi:ubiquinone/menaquinone biosynthesis C-methylase UbiE
MEQSSQGNSAPSWQYDEFRHAGVDYADPRVAEEYDARHARFRDFTHEAQTIAERLGLRTSDCVIDLGCGTGALSLELARRSRTVHAVDVSEAMLALCRRKARERGIDNVETHCAGFLTYEHAGEPAGAIVSAAALHHLPDFWKGVALKRMARMLRPGGRLYLFDVVFSFPVDQHREALEGWIEAIGARAGRAMAEEAAVHVRDEHSTFEWVMDGLLAQAGFRIETKLAEAPHCLAYTCVLEEAACAE